MKYTFLLLFIAMELMASVIKSPIVTVDNEKNIATIKVDSVDRGVSGFVVHSITPEHTTIMKNATVIGFDKEKKIATVKMSAFDFLQNNALPTSKYKPAVGDTVTLAFGYSRALLIAPSEAIYHEISKSVKIQWIHPDLFATVLSFAGHPTPLKEDFISFSNAADAGLLFIYLDKKVYTIDIKSFKILNITNAPLKQKTQMTPFYTRVEKIDAAWWGAGSSRMDSYAPHYYKLLVENNKKNKALYKIIANNKNQEIHALVSQFTIGE